MEHEAPDQQHEVRTPHAAALADIRAEAIWYDGLIDLPRSGRTIQIIRRHPYKFLRWLVARLHPRLRVATVSLFWGHKAKVDIVDVNGKFLHFTGCLPAAELPLLTWVVDELGPGDTVLDVGANWGVYSMLAADLGSKVHAFEPNPILAEALRNNLADLSVEVHESALGSSEGMATLEIPKGHSGGSSIRETDAHQEQSAAVTVLPLDSFGETIEPPTFVKLDVEGFEFEVLTGATATLNRSAPAVSIEFHGSEWSQVREAEEAALRVLRELSYELFLIEETGLVAHGGDYSYDSIDKHVPRNSRLNLLFMRQSDPRSPRH